jgi:hypothetical protein
MSERWLWTQKEDIGPSPRDGHRMAYDAARQRVVLFGGQIGKASNVYTNDTWGWDGGAWTQVADTGPGPRVDCGLAYDDSRQRVVLFGGFWFGPDLARSSYLSDTWEWDGAEWTQIADIGPTPRTACALTYDTVRQRVVLFGGSGPEPPATVLSPTLRGDTWEWDGTEWTQIADTGPSKRYFPAMAFDRLRECQVLFGGSTSGSVWVNDTWEWGDDTGWVKRQDIGPQSMPFPTIAYTDKRTVLFASKLAGSVAASQTWEWDGKHWTQRQDMGPGVRQRYALVYDSQRDRVVLFGGRHPQTWEPLGDTWELAIVEQSPE